MFPPQDKDTQDDLALGLEPHEAAEDFNKASGEHRTQENPAGPSLLSQRALLGLGQNQVVAIWILHFLHHSHKVGFILNILNHLVTEENEDAPRALVAKTMDLIGWEGQDLSQFPQELISTEFIQRDLLIKA